MFSIFPRKLNGRFDRLSSRIAEKHFIRKRILDQSFRQVDGWSVEVVVAGMRQLLRLFLNRLDPDRMRVAQTIHGHPGHEIQILVPVDIVQVGSFALDHDGILDTSIGAQNIPKNRCELHI